MDFITGFSLTVIAGLFIALGSLFTFFNRKSKTFYYFTIGLSLGIMIPLLFLNLWPEVFSIYRETETIRNSFVFIFTFALIGIIFLKASERFIPTEKLGTEKKYVKISFLALFTMFSHDLVEGMAIMSATATSLDFGVNLTFSIAINNIIMGMFISGVIYASTKNVKKTVLLIFLSSTAPILGGLIVAFNPIYFNDSFILGSLLSLVSGMIVYLIFAELIPQFKKGELLINTIAFIIGFFVMIGFVV